MAVGCTETPSRVNGVANMLKAPTTPIVNNRQAPISTKAVRRRPGRLRITSPAKTNAPRSSTSQTIVGSSQTELDALDDPWAWSTAPVLAELRTRARDLGLWNAFDPSSHGGGLTNLQYAPLAELSGRAIELAPPAMNCAAPDTGNMEVLGLFGTPEQQEKWLKPLQEATIRSAFAMTEPNVASSDATNIETSIVRDGDHYVINGRKWWTTGAMNPQCAIFILMGKTNPNAHRHHQQSMILVPRETPGVTVERALHVFETVVRTWVELGECVARAGVRKLVLFNSHGGQVSLMDVVARELRQRCNLIVYSSSWYNLPLGAAVDGLFSAQEHRFGIHAGEIETSMMLALHPQLVRMQAAQDFRSTSQDRAAGYPVLGNGKSAKLGWAMQDYNPAGAVGNAAAATADKGRAVIDAAGRQLARHVRPENPANRPAHPDYPRGRLRPCRQRP